MSPPLIIASAVAALGTIFPAKGNKNVSSSGKEVGGGDIIFFCSGVVVGVGVSWLISVEMQRTRIHQRVRLWLASFTDSSSENNGSLSDLAKRALYISELPVLSMGEEDDSSKLCTIVSPKSSLSSSLHVSVLTLKPGIQMVHRKAEGEELYYVISGAGTLCLVDKDVQEGEKAVAISKGQVMVVMPSRIRRMANRGLQELVFMRITDGGWRYLRNDYDLVGVDDELSSATLRLFQAGAHYLSHTIRGSFAAESPSGGVP